MPQINSAKRQDALRGAMWEQKWRGTLEEYQAQGGTLKDSWRVYPELVPNIKRLCLRSPIGLGTYKWNYSPEPLELAIEREIGIIDTAETYGYGKVEKEMGKILRFSKSLPLIATKVSRNHMSKKAIVSAAKRSRDNLQLEIIPLYQIHWPSPKVPWEETFEGLGQLVSEKVINRVGVSNLCVGQISLAMKLAKLNGFKISSVQTRLNLKDSSANDWLIPNALKANLLVLAYSPLAQGGLKNRLNESLRFVWDSGAVPLVKTNSTVHLVELLKVNPNPSPKRNPPKP